MGLSLPLRLVISVLLGYFLGSIPSGFIIGKLHGVDVRQHASGRTGGTNVWRAAGLRAALITVVGDIVKGLLAVLLVKWMFGWELAAALSGAAAVIGHNWSIFLDFRGGAGGITSGAALVALNPLLGGIVVVLALLGLYLSHYASVATLTVTAGGFVVAAIAYLLFPGSVHLPLVYFSAIAGAAAVWSLRPNINRLIHGNERRITLW